MKLSIKLLLLIAVIFENCTGKSDSSALSYPHPRPDSIALPFLPGIVCSDSLDFNLALSPDGMTLYFCRSKQGKWIILQSIFNGQEWSPPITAPFSEQEYSQADPFVTKDGTIYYISNRPRNDMDNIPDFNIWYVKPLRGNTWSEPIFMEAVNSDSTEYYVSLASNGNIYFASNRAGGFGGLDIYVSKLVNGKYTAPENLGPNINTLADEHDPLILGEEEFLVFNSFGRPDSYGEADLYYSKRNLSNSWSKAINMGSLFNTSTYEYCPNLSPDRKYFFFSSEYDVKWISTQKLPFTLSD